MYTVLGQTEKQAALSNVIKARRSTRKFKMQSPTREQINLVIEAGMYAPYSGLTGMKLDELRRIVVLTPGSECMEAVKQLLNEEIRKGSKRMKFLSHFIPKIKHQGQSFIKRIDSMAKHGLPTLEQGAYWIIVLEKKGIPASSNLAIAHVMQNMWLQATALDLGFQLLSVTKTLSKSKKFWQIIDFPMGMYEIDGCLVGYSDQPSRPVKPIPVENYAKWL